MADTEAEYCAQLKVQTKASYDAIKLVRCPYFGEEIVFTSEGFHHLQYDTSGTERLKKDQIRRYKSFVFAPVIIKKAGTLQQHRKYVGPIGRKKGDGFRVVKTIENWCFVALLPIKPGKDICVKVVIRRVGDGPKHFYSVMPFRGPDYLADADPEA